MAHLPSTKQLKYLTAVVEHRHFGKAATSCFVSQSTLSSGIAELEQNLGVTLFERDQSGVKLLPIGQEISQRAQKILTELQDLVDCATAAREPFSSELRLGVIPTIAPYILPQILSYIRKHHPALKVYIHEAMSQPLTEELQSGQLDLLLLALPYPAKNVNTMHLFYDDFLIATPNDHPFSKLSTVSIKDIRKHDLLLLEDGHCIRDHALDACLMTADDLNIPYQATSLNTVTQMVANRLGLTILPEMAIDSYMTKSSGISVTPFIEDNINRSIGLMWRQSTPRVDEFKAIGDLIIESIS